MQATASYARVTEPKCKLIWGSWGVGGVYTIPGRLRSSDK